MDAPAGVKRGRERVGKDPWAVTISLIGYKKIYHRWGLSGMITAFAMLAAKGTRLLSGAGNEA